MPYCSKTEHRDSLGTAGAPGLRNIYPLVTSEQKPTRWTSSLYIRLRNA
jgi:hypothetical protein